MQSVGCCLTFLYFTEWLKFFGPLRCEVQELLNAPENLFLGVRSFSRAERDEAQSTPKEGVYVENQNAHTNT